MTKQRKLAFTLSMMVYPFDLRLSFNETDSELKKWISQSIPGKEEDKIWQYESEHSPARCVMFEGGQGLIRMRKIPTSATEFAALQHEITHYVYFLLGHKIGMKHSLKTTEAYSYLTGYITAAIYNQLWKK
jgi:hypothetical protein